MQIFLRRQPVAGRIFFGLIYGVIALCALAAARVLPVVTLVPACPFHTMTGIACPTCGATRALAQLAHGSVLNALSLNPLLVLAVLLALAWLVLDIARLLFRAPTPLVTVTRSEGTGIRIGVLLLFLANWTFLIARQL
jgi:hypothetical protein